MAVSKGFTLIELIVVLVIAGIFAAFTIPNLIISTEQTRAQTAKYNLLAIAAAQSKYYEDYTAYCTTTTGHTIPCGDNADINANLNLSMSTNDQFTYQCTTTAETIPYNCTATDTYITVLTLDPNNQYPAAVVTCTSKGVVNGPACPS